MRFVFLGPPGAGKGTQARTLSQQRSLPYLATGDIFRQAVAAGTPLGRQVQTYLAQGKLVPDTLTVEVVRERLQRPDCREGFILDGFPRTRPQAETLDQWLRKESHHLDAALLLSVSDEEIVDRLAGRRICTRCQAVFHVKNSPPRKPDLCDQCGGPLQQRGDDRPQTVRQRLRMYREQTAALADYYRLQGLLHEIDGTGSVEEVQERLVSALDQIERQRFCPQPAEDS